MVSHAALSPYIKRNRMKFFIGLCIAFWMLMLASCNNSSTQVVSTVGDSGYTIPYFTELFPHLNDYLHVQDSNFSAERFQEAATIDIPDSAGLQVDMEKLRPFYPYLIFNEDSSFAIDLVTYNYILDKHGAREFLEEQGPDYEAAVIDMKKKERKRLLFFGTMGTVMDATWATPSTLIMAGPVKWTDTDSLQMEVWKYDVKDGKLKKFSYPEMIHAKWSRFPQHWKQKNV